MRHLQPREVSVFQTIINFTDNTGKQACVRAHGDLLIPFQHVNSLHWLVQRLFIKATKLSLRTKLSFLEIYFVIQAEDALGFSLLLILMKQIHRCLTIIIFTRLLNQYRRFIISLY